MIVKNWNIHQVGIFVCQNCENELFSSDRQDKYKMVFMSPFSATSITKVTDTSLPNDGYTYEKGKVLCQKCLLDIGCFEVIEWGIMGAMKLYYINSNLLWIKVNR